jgi:hypothetical protein
MEIGEQVFHRERFLYHAVELVPGAIEKAIKPLDHGQQYRIRGCLDPYKGTIFFRDSVDAYSGLVHDGFLLANANKEYFWAMSMLKCKEIRKIIRIIINLHL